MLLIQNIRQEKEAIIQRLAKRGVDFSDLINQALELDDSRKEIQGKLDDILSQSNKISKSIGQLFAQKKIEEANEMKAKTADLKEQSATLGEALKKAENELQEVLYQIPNSPGNPVPEGKNEEHNKTIKVVGEKPTLTQKLPHWELCEKYNLIDFELGVKITGAGFPVYRGKGARLQRALINWFLDKARDAGYEEIQPPILINEASGIGTGQLPDKEGQMYHMPVDNLYAIPTAEVPITNIYRDVILKEDDFPIKNCGYTPCFRREAGSYGKDVRGLNRLHQFDKVEIVQLQHPEKSYETLEEMNDYVQGLLRDLGLHYRVLLLCGGDTGFASAMTYDMEVWSAAQERWLEVSSVSNFETFQANRLKLRYKSTTGKNQLAHTLNGSALALPRIVASILENNQTPEGIIVPEVLRPYCGFDIID
ncbi:MAG: serine--tRNA ligase [Bacteroidia bacterium]|nr:serine--tRNA ligase [Bacteroidia bacterium]|tara:strand:- start:15067 stop:16335 length:1269 start_codon:yes stop_codon:yes gene_type:complete